MSVREDLVEGLIVTPEEVRQLTHKYVDELSNKEKMSMGVRSGLKELDLLLNPLKEGQMRVIMGRPSNGKCLGRGTKVIMFDGSMKSVEDVVDGDLLMGPDSTPRMVSGTASGIGPLYKIKQQRGIDYIVNDSHVLVFKRKKNEKLRKHGEVRTFTAEQFFNNRSTIKTRWSGFISGVEFDDREVPLDPYLFGVWLGDGDSSAARISNVDRDLIDIVYSIAEGNGWGVTESFDSRTNCGYYQITNGGKHSGGMVNILRDMNVINNKHIPNVYLTNSRKIRLELLAGLIDTDGSLTKQNNFDFCQKRKSIADSVTFLCNSLGFRVTNSERIIDGGVYYRQLISGDLTQVPCRIARKQPVNRVKRTDSSMTGVDIEFIGEGEYFGFELDGDHLFLLEDFTVTHNTALMAHFNRDTAQWLVRSKNKEKGPPIFISAEMAIEELALREVSNYIPLDSVLIERGEAPSWEDVHNGIDETAMERPTIYIGHTLMKGGRRPKLSVENIMRCVETVQDKFGKTPALISVDYAQRLKLDKQTRDRRGEVSEIVETIKDMALRFAVPVQLGSQVGRQVDDRIPPVPTLSDAKETANLEETADSVLAVMRPMRYYEIGEAIKKTGKEELLCSENLFFIEVLKQRQGKIGGCWCYFDMKISQLADLEIVDLNDPKHWG